LRYYLRSTSIRMMGSPGRRAPCVANVEHFRYTEYKSIIFLEESEILGKEIFPSATLPRTYLTLIGPRSIPGLQNEVPMNTRVNNVEVRVYY
jgi:hypothetical protein